jgi:hypothetical protein
MTALMIFVGLKWYQASTELKSQVIHAEYDASESLTQSKLSQELIQPPVSISTESDDDTLKRSDPETITDIPYILRTEPEQSSVYVEDYYIGKTPINLREHFNSISVIRIEHAGYKSQQHVVNLNNHNRDLIIKLKPINEIYQLEELDIQPKLIHTGEITDYWKMNHSITVYADIVINEKGHVTEAIYDKDLSADEKEMLNHYLLSLAYTSGLKNGQPVSTHLKIKIPLDSMNR